MALTFFWNCEAEDFSADNAFDSPFTGTSYSVGDDIATAALSATLSATADRVGTNGILSLGAAASRYDFDTDIWPGAGTPGTTVGSAAFSFNFRTAMPGAQTLGLRIRGSASASNIIGVQLAASQELALRIGNTTANIELVTSAVNIAADTWYGVVIRWDLANDKRCIEVYNASNVLIEKVEDTTTNLSTYIPAVLDGNVNVGIKSSAGANDIWFDNFFIANTYAEPLQYNLTIANYASYSTSVAPAVTDVDSDELVTDGEVITVTGTNFGATQGASTVALIDGAIVVLQTATSWGDTSITFTAASTALPFGAIDGVRVTTGGGSHTLPVTHEVPAGYAYGVIDVPWTAGTESVFQDAAPAVVDGDQYQYETTTNVGSVVEVFPDGTFLIDALYGTHEFDVRVFDQTSEAWSAWVTTTAISTATETEPSTDTGPRYSRDHRYRILPSGALRAA